MCVVFIEQKKIIWKHLEIIQSLTKMIVFVPCYSRGIKVLWYLPRYVFYMVL